MTERMEQKTIKRKFMAWLLLVCILLSGCGDWRNTFYTESSLKRVAAKSLKEKYGEEFVVHRVWNKSSSMFFTTCSPKDDPEVLFQADIRKNGDGVVADGYTQGVIAKELDEILRDDFHELFGDCYTRAAMPNYYNKPEFQNPKTVTLKEYMSQVDFNFLGMGYDVFILESQMTNDSIEKEYELLSGKIQKMVEDGVIPDVVIDLYFGSEEMVKKAEEYFSTRTTYDSIYGEELDKFVNVYVAYPDGTINKTYEEYKEMRMEVGKNE